MSADRDRGTRRQKQKRAKELKKQRRQPAPALTRARPATVRGSTGEIHHSVGRLDPQPEAGPIGAFDGQISA